jgi:hypothetical protein
MKNRIQADSDRGKTDTLGRFPPILYSTFHQNYQVENSNSILKLYGLFYSYTLYLVLFGFDYLKPK